MEEARSIFKILTGKPTGKTPLGTPRRRWEDNIKMDFHNLFSSPNTVRLIKSRRLKCAGHVARIQEGGSAFKMLTGTPAGKRPLGRPGGRWEDIQY